MMRRILMTAGLWLAAMETAAAQLAVDRLWIEFDDPRERAGDVLVVNNGDERFYIMVTTSEIVLDENGEEVRVTSDNPDELGLLTTPNRMILDPGEAGNVRIVRIAEDTREDRVYRVKIEPRVGALSIEGESEASRTAGIRVLSAYDVLVTARPDEPVWDLEAVREDGVISITNTGNTNILLFEVRICPNADVPEDEEAAMCEQRPSMRLRAGERWRAELPSPDAEIRLSTQNTLDSDPVARTF